MEVQILFHKLDQTIDEFWGYRKALVKNIIVEVSAAEFLNTDSPVLIWDKIREYVERNGFRMNNHISWRCGGIYFHFADSRIVIGTAIDVGDY